MKTSKYYIVVVIILSVFTFSCTDNKPEDLIPEDQYIDIFTELSVLNQLRDEQLQGVSREYLREQIFERHNTPEEVFRASHNYYQRDAEKQTERIELVVKKLEKERELIQAYVDSLKGRTDETIEINLDELRSQEADSL